MSSSIKLNNLDLSTLSEQQLKQLCNKYQIVQPSELISISKDKLLDEVKSYLSYKIKNYKGTRLNKDGQVIIRDRRMSQPNALKIVKTDNTPPQSTEQYNRDRRMSHPITSNEVKVAKETHLAREQIEQGKQEIQSMKVNPNMQKYDELGMYPAVSRLVAVGDLHGDLKVTLQVLRLAKVIPRDIYPNNVDQISWCGGSTWIVQCGDQIDRCRPDGWKKNCIEDWSDVVEDEGSNMRIIKIFQNLDVEARKCGGRVLGLLGNHELMNVDKDYRYVSPEEFLEFVPVSQRGPKFTDDGYPMGYYHRLKSFERGGNIAKHYAFQKKSIIQVGKFVFVHGGIGHALASKYTIHEINSIVKKWLLKQGTDKDDEVFDEIFRSDDDISPFWCRLYSEEDNEDENTEQGFNQLLQILNKRNEVIQPIGGVVVAHTPQFMNDRFLNSRYNDRLWRVDVGMSRAFGKHDNCGDNKYRQIQILVITNDKEFEILKTPYDGRVACEGIGEKVNVHSTGLPW